MFASWKTTLFGIGAGILNLVSQGVSWKSAGLSVMLGLFGIAAKDSNVTGGTKVQ